MPDPTAPRVFVTYDPGDLSFARELQADLQVAGVSLYQDLADLDDAPDRWRQIETTIKVVDHVVVVLTPRALKSNDIPTEWRLALREGKQVWLVTGPGRLNFSRLPRWMKRANRYDFAIPESRDRLIAGLRNLASPRRVPFMAAAPSHGGVRRVEKLGELKRRLLDAEGAPAAVTVALTGVAGCGKTSLADALCHEPDIRQAFDGGILRVILGEKPADLVRTMAELIFALNGKDPDLTSVDSAKTGLAEALDGRRCLLVIDDARRLHDLEPFLRRGSRDSVTRLLATRDDRLLPPDVDRIAVGAMTTSQALEMLGHGLPDGTTVAHRSRFTKLAARLGERALLLRLANRVLRSGLALGAGLEASLGHIEQSLERGEPATDILDLSLEQLQGGERDRFVDLSVFAEGAEIPVEAALGLWQQTAEVGRSEGEGLLARLDELSLLLGVDRGKDTFRLHDVFRTLLRARLSTDELAALNRQLMAHFRSTCPDGDLACLSDSYGLRYATTHLRDGGEGPCADLLLLDPRWMRAKLDALGTQPLLSDYAGYRPATAQGRVGATLALVADSIAHRPRELVPHLIGRLTASDAAGLEACLSKAHALVTPPTLLPLRPTLAPPGPELRRFDGHGGSVTCVAVLADGRQALSGSEDGTLRLWDIDSGATLRRLEGHGGAVTCVALLADGRHALAGCEDRSLRLWDIQSGAQVRRFDGHEEPVTSVAILPDGKRALSGSRDNTVRLWDIESGVVLRRFEGHDDWVNCVAALPDERRVLSGSDDNTLRLWDIESGAELRRFGDHGGSFTCLAVLPDGRRVLSGSDDHTLRLWDMESAAELRCYEGHEHWITSVAALPDGQRALSASSDNSLRLWDIESGVELRRFDGHESDEGYEGDIASVAILPDGQGALSGSNDNTLRLWNIGSSLAQREFERHQGPVTNLSTMADGRRVLSGAQDDTFRLWDIASGAELRRFEGHESGVTSLALLPDGQRALSASYDSIVSLWDIESGTELRRFHANDVVSDLVVLPKARRAMSGSRDGTLLLWSIVSGAPRQHFKRHGDWVTCVALSANARRALSGSFDNSLRLWDIASGTELRCFEGHTDRVQCVAILPDERRALSGSNDRTLRLWDIKSGAELRRFDGHRNEITCVAVLPDGRRALSGSFDNSLRLWDIDSGAELASLTFDEHVGAIAWSEPHGAALVGDGQGRIHTIGIAGYASSRR